MTSSHPTLPHISVSIINYRTARMTLDCLDSVLTAAGAVPGLRVTPVVVDNASGDGSADRIAAWIDEKGVSDVVRLVRSPTNSGFSGGHNQGIAAIDSDFVLVLNSDATLRADFFRPMIAATREHPEAGRFVPRLEDPDGTPQVSCFRWPSAASEFIRGAGSGPVTRILRNHTVPLGYDPDPAEIDWVSFACVLLRRSMIEEIGPMDEGYFLYFEDCEYNLRAHRAGFAAVFVPEARATHIGGASGTVPDLQSAKRRLPEYFYRSRSRFFYQAYGRFGLLRANLAWLAGRGVAALRLLAARRIPAAHQNEGRDIWTGFPSPLAASGRPDA